jgi:hypothetical protein
MATSIMPVKITSTLFEVYRQYKTSTSTVLEWLNKHGSLGSSAALEIDQLQGAAGHIVAENIKIPEAVYRAFRDAVSKRWKVTNWFLSAERVVGAETSSTTQKHIYYTERQAVA